MKLVTAWDPVGKNQFVLKEECRKCYVGEKYIGILSGQVICCFYLKFTTVK